LINPNGIIFGPNATLNVAGSFVATTADAIAFPDGNSFSASAKNVPAPTLTVSPSAFLFNQIAAAPITNQSRVGLQVPEGESLLLLGGNVNVDGGVLRAPGGLIQLGGVASSGTVNITDPNTLLLSFPDDVARADVSLTNGAIVDVVSGGGGDIAIYARNISIAGEETNVCAGIGTSGSSCNTPGSAVGSANSTAGNILFDATGTVAISQSRIENNVNPGATGNSDSIFEAIANDTLLALSLSRRGLLN
jgi:large exoprotein involved in heme utilization and adhesion